MGRILVADDHDSLRRGIVRKIVDAHDGRIDLTSSPQTGTRFRVTLPVSSKSSWFK